MTRRLLIPAAAVALAAALAWDLSARVHRGAPVTVQDTASGPAYRALADRYEAERRRADGQAGLVGRLRARIEGLERRRPERVVVYDTLVRVDTVTVFLRVEADDGRLRALAASPADSTGLRAPRLDTYDVRGCDRWWIDGSGLICRRSPWGHLWAGFGVGAARDPAYAAWVGGWARWRPSLDSPWSVGVEVEPDRQRVYLGREIRVF